MLRGRPFGGVMTMIRNELRAVTETVLCDERYVVVRVANCLIVNVYKCKKLWFIHELTAHYTLKTAKITKK